VFKRHPAANRKSVQAVRNLEAFTVIESDRPEGIHRRRTVLLEMQNISIRTIQWLACIVCKVERIDRVLWQVRAKTQLGDNRALQVVVAVNTHGVSVHRPAVFDTGHACDLPCHQRQGVLGSGFQPRLDRRINIVEVETLASLDPDPLQLGEDRLVSDVRWLYFENVGGVSEELARRHCIYLGLWRGFHVDAGIDGPHHRLGMRAPVGQRRDF
jgi:hypothetical protein